MKHASDASLRKGIGIAAALLVALHILLSLFFLLTPRSAQHSGPISLMYNRLVLIGPFFDEARIKTSPHLYIRTFENGQWSDTRDFAAEYRAFYRSHPWRQDRFRMTYFEQYISNKLGLLNKPLPADEVRESGLFRELNQFVLQEYIRRPVDSISLVYGVNRFFPQTNTIRFDTTYKDTYNPASIVQARRTY